jgi:adenylate cyclase
MATRAKLAVILHADVVGSTGLVQKDEQLAHERIQDAFGRFSETISSHGGTPHEIRGDALVAGFERASDAVTAALAFQAANHAHNQELTGEIRPHLRIGIALGEVVIDDQTVTGAGVVVAQRLEQLADPDGVVIQGAVHETVPRRLPVAYRSLGDQMLKGFDEPIRAFVVSDADAGAGSAPDPEASGWTSGSRSLKLPEKPSLAVLPFTELSAPETEYFFADGLSEDLITTLSTISSLFVISRHSSFAYGDRTIDVRTIASELGVRYVLEGKVRSSGDRLRVTVQLVDAQTGENVYADRFDRTVDSVFDVQDEITREIVTALRVQLTDGEQARLWWRYTESLESWTFAMQGWDLLHRGSAETNSRARDLLERAIIADPNNAIAIAWLAQTLYLDARFGFSDSSERSLELAEQFARQAMAMDPGCPHAHVALGTVLASKSEFNEAIKEGRLALEASPNDAWVKVCHARILLIAGLPEEAEELMRQAMRLDPRYPNFYLGILGNALMDLRRDVEAEEILAAAVEREPEYFSGHLRLAALYGLAGRSEEARYQVSELLRINPRFDVSRAEAFIGLGNPESLRRFVEGIRLAGVPE